MKKPPAIFRKMTDTEVEAVLALARVRYPPATFHKRFARDMQGFANQPIPQCTDRQIEVVRKMLHRYRRQIPGHAEMLAAATRGRLMPIYVYRCEKCETKQEGFFNLSEPVPNHCEQPMVKLLQPALIAFQTAGGNMYRHSVRDPKWVGAGRPKPKVIGKKHGLGGRRKNPTMQRALELAGGRVVDPVKQQVVKGRPAK